MDATCHLQRCNPRSDRFCVHGFHHLGFWTADATNTSKRWGGPPAIAHAASQLS
jgi:4-hydroxyphenylpyruvate dioxygenase